jgi:hypothetical protein
MICILFSLLFITLVNGKRADALATNTKEITAIEMQQEIMRMWNTWYKEQDIWTQKELKENKKNWPELAKELANSVKKYQHTPVQVYEWKNKKVKLPIGKDVHLMAGMMAIYETKVRNDIIGDLGEIGILQCHPKWCLVRNKELNKLPIETRKEYAKKNPKLNLDAAIKHLTVSYGICNKKVRELDDWAYSVAHYGTGSLALENGHCIKRNFAKSRVYRMQSYRKKIRK